MQRKRTPPSTRRDRVPRAGVLRREQNWRRLGLKKESESIAFAEYEPNEWTLRVGFRAKDLHQAARTYDYLEVPPGIVRALLAAEAPGAFLNQRIKPNYEFKLVG